MPLKTDQPKPLFSGSTPLQQPAKTVRGETVTLLGDRYYKIENYDAMEPFFISLVSSSDHWLFIASTGGLSAGRVSAETAIFPYYTVDKLTENSENTGHKAILRVRRARRTHLWEPFSDRQRGLYAITRNLYKNEIGTALIFEENNLDLGLTYRYAWRTGEKFGFIKTSWLINTADSPCRVELLDGIQNILPANVASLTQNTFGSLLDAYKRSELHAETGLGIFALNSTLTDLAEPSESLLATSVAQIGLTPSAYLLSSTQLDRYRDGGEIDTETEVRGRRGAYFARAALRLAPWQERSWHLLVDIPQDSAAIVQKIHALRGSRAALLREVEEDIAANRLKLWQIVAGADGVQLSNHPAACSHHFANVMFNLMRGGSFTDQYTITTADFADFVAVRNPLLRIAQADFFAALPEKIQMVDLQSRAAASAAPDLLRLSFAYLPLSFSRRHGDPSRPWNRFEIRIKKPDGSPRLDYEGNWRDIFQNWEALAYSYPEFLESMLSIFLNATTVDGYNPYRITHHGVDWELPEPGNPWANIGYWSDHQIIYLQKLMEISHKLHPGRLVELLDRPMFSYVHVPYQIKPYAELLQDPYNTINFNWDLQRQIEARLGERGTDGKLVLDPAGQILQVSLAEKLLSLLLAKLANFVPEGGIWMSTQRPEWNDANNALVGKGLSVVTLFYLRRMLAFCRDLFGQGAPAAVSLSVEVQRFFTSVSGVLDRFSPVLQGSFDDGQRRAMLDELGEAGSAFRWNFYRHGLSGQRVTAPLAEITAFLDLAQRYVEHSLRANCRADALYHSYNILRLAPGRASIGRLVEMLEGQVAALSSGLLSESESLALLQSLRAGPLYQAAQHSYILYPDRNPPAFLAKNCLTPAQVAGVPLFARLIKAGDTSIIARDRDGFYHFNGAFRNFQGVSRALEALKSRPHYARRVAADFEKIRALFEATFHHEEFTGRSSTFFAYEGLGSVYWHMVSKLLLAAQEAALRFRSPALLDRYEDIRRGLGFNKSPAEYGAFPTDPYSHTPRDQGAKQPGMTGLVKEEILTRQAELGFTVAEGRLVFDLLLLDPRELLVSPATFAYLDVQGTRREIELPAGSLAYTICQVPVVLQAAREPGIRVHFADGDSTHEIGHGLDEANSRHIFQRDGVVHHLIVTFLPK